MYRACIPTLLLVVLASVGCGPDAPKTIPVTGTVTLDGKPLEGASVTFMSTEGSRVASGTTDASGSFTLKTVIGSLMVDGAVPGTHKIGVAKTESSGTGETRKEGETDQEMVARMAGNATNTSKIKQKYIVPQKYNSPEGSGLTATVAEGGGPVELNYPASNSLRYRQAHWQ